MRSATVFVNSVGIFKNAELKDDFLVLPLIFVALMCQLFVESQATDHHVFCDSGQVQ